jgi:hypothetical protein
MLEIRETEGNHLAALGILQSANYQTYNLCYFTIRASYQTYVVKMSIDKP